MYLKITDLYCTASQICKWFNAYTKILLQYGIVIATLLSIYIRNCSLKVYKKLCSELEVTIVTL